MDLVLYDPPSPELPLPDGARLAGGVAEPPAPGPDWGTYVIRLAQALARREPGPA